MKVSFVIPCYNEAGNIDKLEAELFDVSRYLRKYELEFVFVNDGSTDMTENALDLMVHSSPLLKGKLKVVSYPKNMGLGNAVREGFKEATGDYIFVMDSDCSYSPKYILKMLKLIRNNDIVTVSPYMEGGAVVGVPAHRLILSKGVNFLYGLASGMKIHTFTAMVRLYKNNIKNIEFKNNGFLSQAELLFKAHYNGFKVVEVPADLEIDTARKSNMKIVKTIWSHLKFLARVFWWRLTF